MNALCCGSSSTVSSGNSDLNYIFIVIVLFLLYQNAKFIKGGRSYSLVKLALLSFKKGEVIDEEKNLLVSRYRDR